MDIRDPELTDEYLIRSALDGDDEAFAVLVRRHRQKVFGIAGRFARHDHELDDLAQEIFLKAYRNLGRFRQESPFEHWLSRIAVRTCYDALRKRRREGSEVPIDDLAIVAENDIEPMRAKELLDRALVRLSAEQRLVITLLELEERSVREVAALTGWSETNVKVRAFRAREALKRILEADYERPA
ncbi:MAG: RNA polymerase sigma factor [Verrucomicrobia bacterium]|nr:RNA polymerase sigma factor [Verrucomicrobiota bacterium]